MAATRKVAVVVGVGSGVFADVESITAEQFEQSWRVNAYGAFLCGDRSSRT